VSIVQCPSSPFSDTSCCTHVDLTDDQEQQVCVTSPDALVYYMERFECGSMEWADAFDRTMDLYAPMVRLEFALSCVRDLMSEPIFLLTCPRLVIGGRFFFGSCRAYLPNSITSGGDGACPADTVRFVTKLTDMNRTIIDGLKSLSVHLVALRVGDTCGFGGFLRAELLEVIAKSPPSYIQIETMTSLEHKTIDGAINYHRRCCNRFMQDGGCDWESMSLIQENFMGLRGDTWDVIHANGDDIHAKCRYPVVAAGSAILPFCPLFSAVALPKDIFSMQVFGERCLRLWENVVEKHGDCIQLPLHWMLDYFSDTGRESVHFNASWENMHGLSAEDFGLACVNSMLLSSVFCGPLVDMHVIFVVEVDLSGLPSSVVVYRRFSSCSFMRISTSHGPFIVGGLSSHMELDVVDVRREVVAHCRQGAHIMSMQLKMEVAKRLIDA
jgi:hypothetical protein